MNTTEIPTPQPGCDGDPMASITEHWADLLGCTKSMCQVMRSFNSSIDIGYAPMGLGEQVWAELTTLSNLVDAARISITPSIIASGRWKTEGSKSPEDWLAGQSGSSTGKARSQLETGKNLRNAPGTQESFLNGDISAEQADTIADAVEANPAAEQDLLDQAKRDSLKNLKDEAARRKAEVEDIEERERRLHRKRYVRQWTDKEGAWNLRARGPIPTGSEFMAVLEGLIDQQFKKARKAGVRGTRDNYGYDALMDLANQHGWGTGTRASGPTDGGGGGNGPGGDGPDGTGPVSDGRNDGRSGGNKPGAPPSDQPVSGEPTATGSDSSGPTESGPTSNRNSFGRGPSNGSASRKPATGEPQPGTAPSGAWSPSEPKPGDLASKNTGPTDPATGSAVNGRDPGSEPSAPFEGRLFDLDPASPGGEGPSGPERRPQAKPSGRKQGKPAKQRIFCIDWTALTRGRIHPGERCDLRGVGMVSVRAIRQTLVSGTARMVVTDSDDRVVTVALIGTGAINGRLFPMGSSTRAPLEAPDAEDLTPAEASASNGPSTVIVGVRLMDLVAPTAPNSPSWTNSRTIDIAGVGPVDHDQVTRFLGDALSSRLAERGQAIRAITHTGRAPSANQRVALAWADTTCKVSGCHNQRVEIDHRNPWAADRVTELHNLDPLCGHHHSLKTHEGWAFTVSTDGDDYQQFVPPTDLRHPSGRAGSNRRESSAG